MSTVVHLVRHCDVENPDNIWYGRLAGYHLSAVGQRRAALLGHHFAGATLSAVYASPLERAQETAAAIAAPRGLAVETEEDLLESLSFLQGQPADRRVLRRVANFQYFVNPFRPSWGEPYTSIAARMVRAVDHLRLAHPEGEVVGVSHMTPIMVARVAVEGRPLRPWLARVPCARGSITSLVFEGDAWVRTIYQETPLPDA